MVYLCINTELSKSSETSLTDVFRKDFPTRLPSLYPSRNFNILFGGSFTKTTNGVGFTFPLVSMSIIEKNLLEIYW